MKVEFLPEARDELIEAAVYYEEMQPGLGMRFRNEVAEIVVTIQQHPLLWRERHGGFRRVHCPVFPYYVAYFIRKNIAVIAAVAHSSRYPDYWKERMK